MIKINKKTKLPNKCNKEQTKKLGALEIRNNFIDKLLEERLRRDI